MDTLDRMREDANNWIVGDLSYSRTGQEILPQRGRIRRMDRMRGDADNWILGDLSYSRTGKDYKSS